MLTIRKLLIVLLVSSLGLMSLANAAEKKSKTEAVSRSTYKSLEKIQNLMSEDKNQQAVTELKALYADIEKGTMDEAVVSQMFGYGLMATENYKEAIGYFEISLKTNLMPETTNNNMRYMLAQLLANENDYKGALVYADDWYKDAEEIKPSQNMFMANLNVQAKQYKQAIPYIDKAIAAEKVPKESWYQLLVGCHYELKQFSSAAQYLKQMVGNWPDNKNYWEQLAGIYLKLDKEADALAVLDLAWRNGILDKESSIKTLVQYAINFGIPDRAARILEKAMAEGQLENNTKTLQVLASAWIRAKEVDKAIDSYQQLVTLGEDKKASTRLARLYIEKEDWANAQQTLKQTLTTQGIDKAQTYLLLGIAYVKDNQLELGKETLRKAAAFDSTKSQANSWISFANQKLQTQNSLARAAAKAKEDS